MPLLPSILDLIAVPGARYIIIKPIIANNKDKLNLYFFLYHFGAILVELLQVRGSSPLPWEQVVDLTYKPKFELLKHDEAVSGC